MKRAIAEVLGITAVMAASTWLLGWWTVPVVAVIAGAIDRAPGAGWRAALAGALAWGMLVAADAASGTLAGVATPLAATMRVPAAVLVLLTLAYPALLAWSGATIGQVVRRR